ncbi:MAG: hypothetical protein J2P46_02620 [Zavarzinella sp.]|nr:hypothetical protein [Zavarzinella sp.]
MPRHDDDDDRPRRRRPRDEDEDAPRTRRRRDDDDDDDRPRTRRREDFDQYAAPRRKKPRTQMSTLGAIGFGIGALALLVSFMPCFASISLVPAGIGIVIGFIALVLAQRSEGRQGVGMPIAALSISAVAVLIGVGWLVLGKQIEKRFEKEVKEAEAQAAKDEAQRKADVARAAKDVQAADPEGVIRMSAAQFFQAYENDSDRADARYKNKVIEITGTIHQVDFQGEVYTVLLNAGQQEFETVDCHFAKTPAIRDRLAELRPGQTVTIRGKCLGTVSDLEGCILVN